MKIKYDFLTLQLNVALGCGTLKYLKLLLTGKENALIVTPYKEHLIELRSNFNDQTRVLLNTFIKKDAIFNPSLIIGLNLNERQKKVFIEKVRLLNLLNKTPFEVWLIN